MSISRGLNAEHQAVYLLTLGRPEVEIAATLGASPADFVVRTTGKDGNRSRWLGVQVKRAYRKNGHLTINLVRGKGKRYQPGDFDYVLAVDGTGMFIFPEELVRGKTRLRITNKHLYFYFMGANRQNLLGWQRDGRTFTASAHDAFLHADAVYAAKQELDAAVYAAKKNP